MATACMISIDPNMLAASRMRVSGATNMLDMCICWPFLALGAAGVRNRLRAATARKRVQTLPKPPRQLSITTLAHRSCCTRATDTAQDRRTFSSYVNSKPAHVTRRCRARASPAETDGIVWIKRMQASKAGTATGRLPTDRCASPTRGARRGRLDFVVG
eukprot:6184676-Pleurochrysis_carterae.AAC.1